MSLFETAQAFIQRKRCEFEADLDARKSISMKDIGRNGSHHFLRVAWTFLMQHNLPQKVFVVERMEWQHRKGKAAYRRTRQVGEIEYRIGYFIVGRNGNRKNRWTWGQYCPIIPAKDLTKLLAKARKEGTII